MPEIKCEYGHPMRVGTDEWINQLSLDQLRYARQQMADKIDKAEQGPRRTVWLVDDGITVAAFYREEAYPDAADHLVRIYKEVFLKAAEEFSGRPGSLHDFRESTPHIEPRRVTQFEYDTEWFPSKTE